ncbi:E3 ubiquitin/ISG15 ligase TRIM25-like, partial [Limanda limanda]|uniref:E3 ubiquitin/ISG15 ligase TRIM25-like n=1 Tax=Limanda limanda TaxID=27771 RepID=UPI0029C6B605
NQLDRERFCCLICVDLLKDPVTTVCGHSYCKSCINTHWDKEEERGSYSCPQCRQTFTPRPVLVKNTMLAFSLEELKKNGLQAAPADHCYTGPEDVACDVCTGSKRKSHLQPHLQPAPLKKHKLVEPSEKLQENICSRHDEVMKMFCGTDQQCICYLCSVEDHKDHDTVSAAAERTERQRELGLRRQTIQQRVQDTEKDVKLLQQEEEAVNGSADKAVEDSEEIFTELIRLLEKRSSDRLEQQIRSQQETEVSRVRELQERLEQEITELKRKDYELKQLSDTEDHNQLLHNYPSLSPLSESTHSSSISIRPLRNFEDVTAAVSQVRGRLQDILSETGTKILQIVSQVDVLLGQPEPETRADFLKYSQEITLDPNTANRQLLLSEGNRKVTWISEDQSCSDHPDRFTDWWQVLSRESLTGRCYWEVKMSRGGEVDVAVVYKNIRRAGNSLECLFGCNDKSWSLSCVVNSYNFYYNCNMTPVSGPRSSRVGVYLDHSAGVLSFYRVSDTMTLLHRVQTTFTQPLYAGVNVYYGATAQLDRERFCCPICLVKNTMLADLVEELKKTGIQAAPADHCSAGPEDVACDVCTGRKLKALKSCLNCLASYCEKHLQPHFQAAAFKKHKLVEPSEKLQENICSRHDELMKMFCRTDQQCICYLCSVDEHKDHDTVSAAAERTERQRELRLRRQTIQQRVQDTEKDVKLLQQEEEALNGSADKAVEDSEEIFTELIRLLEKRSSDVKQQIRSQQETEVSRVRELQERLEQEINELKRKDHELKQLSDTEDHNQFLHNYPSLSPLSGSTHSSSFRIRPLRNFEDVRAALSQVRGRLQDILSETGTKILQIASQVDVLLPQPAMKNRVDFLKYSQKIKLNRNTANNDLLLSEGNRKVTRVSEDQDYSDHPERFTNWPQVLSRESLTGRCYWEVKMSRGGRVDVAVTYKNIRRVGCSRQCGFGSNDKSWSLYCDVNSYNFSYNNIKSPVSGPWSSRVGVYLDHSAGVLSFYSVTGTMTLLHRVQTTFTQPLCAGVRVGYGATAEFC